MIQFNTISALESAYRSFEKNPEQFWDTIAKTFHWQSPWHTTLHWNFIEPNVKWFDGGITNICYNCVDRHLPTLGHQKALIWEPNDPQETHKSYTYEALHQQVVALAKTMVSMGIQKGDRVCLYMPMIPELTFAVLACARIGAIHSVVFAGFSAQSLTDRLNDAACKWVLTADALYRGAKTVPLKNIVDEALQQVNTVEKVLVFNRCNWEVNMVPNRDFWYHDMVDEAQNMPDPISWQAAETPLFILYTSGSTGKPKGVVHTTGGYMVYAGYTFANVFQYQKGETFFCSADIGWITGHSYLVYGPLLNGATTVMFEGIPTYPDASRFWQIIEKYNINIFYTAPTAIRSLMQYGLDPVLQYPMHSLRVLGTVGEPINEEAWHWYNIHVGKQRCPITDTWWQTETGGIMIATLAGVQATLPAHAGFPLPGIVPVLLNAEGTPITAAVAEGYLALAYPWPGMIRTTWGDHERCRLNYFAAYPGFYFTGDGAKRDAEGRYRIIGRVDDVINVSGHRFGTAEIENAINQHPAVIESAVVGFPHHIKGQGIYAFVITDPAIEVQANIKAEIIEVVAQQIGKIAIPDQLLLVSGLPKTRSGKIMRRILRKIAESEYQALGDVTTLLDPAIVAEIVAKAKLNQSYI